MTMALWNKSLLEDLDLPITKMETYRCLNNSLDNPCGKEFTSPVGPVMCPWCKSQSVEWVSYGKTLTPKKTAEQVQQEFIERMFNEE